MPLRNNMSLLSAATDERPMRAEWEFTRLNFPFRIPTETELTEIERVEIDIHALQRVIMYLWRPGVLRGGPLFATPTEEGILKVKALPEGASPVYLAQHGPLALSSEYLLGYSERFRHYRSPCDWYGQWVIAADSSLRSDEWRRSVLATFQADNLLRENLVVVFIGMSLGRPVALGYTLRNGRVVEVPCTTP